MKYQARHGACLPIDDAQGNTVCPLISPHSAGTGYGENGPNTDIFCHNLRCYLDGRLDDMRNVLDKQLMY